MTTQQASNPRRTPGIYSRRNRDGSTSYVIHPRDSRGRQFTRSYRTLSEAKRAKSEFDRGGAQPDSQKRFDVYAPEWLDSNQGRTARGLSDSTRDSYRDAIERFAIPHFGSKKLADIGRRDVAAFITKLEATEQANGQRLQAASVRRYFAPVRALFKTAVADELLSSDPTYGVPVIVRTPRRPRTPMALTPEQYRALIEATPEAWKPLVRFLGNTGTRISEAVALEWRDVDREAGTVYIRESKTEAGRRFIPLTAEMREMLSATAEMDARRAAAARNSTSKYVFPATRNGTKVDPHNFRRIFRAAAERAGVPWATPHKLRHTALTLLAQTMPIADVARFAGHTDAGFTQRTYVHATGTMDPAAALEQALAVGVDGSRSRSRSSRP